MYILFFWKSLIKRQVYRIVAMFYEIGIRLSSEQEAIAILDPLIECEAGS